MAMQSSSVDLRSTVPHGPPSSRQWGEARLVMMAFFGLVGIALFRVAFLDENQIRVFSTFLTGQIGWEGAFSSAIFWKLLAGFTLGATAGYLFSREIPKEHLERANGPARVAALVMITLAVYIPAMSAGYIWDDDQEITANPALQSAAGLVEIWKGTKSADYFPLKTTMLWIEYQIWGLSPYGYHVVNILLHALDAVLLFYVLRRLRVPGAWFAALLFAVHPVHVESVAWISERKNTLSLLFYLLAIGAYLRFQEDGKPRRYLGSIGYYLAALLCKTSVVMLPVVLLLCTWWKKGRLAARDLLCTIPFFLLSLGMGLLTVHFQYGRAIAQEVIPIGDFWSRLAGAGLAVWWYLQKALFPTNLITTYPRWPIDPPQAGQFVAGALVIGLLALLWFKRDKLGRTPFFVFAYFVVTLFPVMGFFKMSYMRITLVADHFQYLSDISIVALMGAAAAVALRKAGPALRPAVISACVLLACAFSAYSWERAGVHHSEKTLWADTLKKNPDSWQAHNHYGAVIYNEGKPGEAIVNFRRAVELNPANPEVHNNYGLTLAAFDRWDEAIAEYREAVRIKGDFPAMRRNLADALTSTKQYTDAAIEYRILIDQEPRDPVLYIARGYVLYELGRLVEAKQSFETALKLNPGNRQAQQNLQVVTEMLAKRQ